MSFCPYVSFKGKAQGIFKAQPSQTHRRNTDWVEVISFRLGTEPPYDVVTGKPRGARTHQPVTITTEISSATPQLLNPQWKAGIFDKVVLELVGRPASGAGEIVAQRITLTNASIAKVTRYVPALGDTPSRQTHIKFLMETCLAFEKIAFHVF